MFRNMAVSLVMTMKQSDGQTGGAKVSGRIVTTVAKAKELRPLIEKIITMGRKARRLVSDAEKFASPAARGSDEWKAWRESENGKNWVRATAPALALRFPLSLAVEVRLSPTVTWPFSRLTSVLLIDVAAQQPRGAQAGGRAFTAAALPGNTQAQFRASLLA